MERRFNCATTAGACDAYVILTEPRSVWYDAEAGTCFAVSDARLSWSESTEQCQRLHGGQLAVVATTKHLSAVGQVTAAAGHPAAWVGGHRVATPWSWSDGTLLGNETPHMIDIKCDTIRYDRGVYRHITWTKKLSVISLI